VADTLRPAQYCSLGFSESILASREEVRNTDNAGEFKVPALRAAKPVTKSRRVIVNFIDLMQIALFPVRKKRPLES
jgi:hypothetical protein